MTPAGSLIRSVLSSMAAPEAAIASRDGPMTSPTAGLGVCPQSPM
jgi:hypothetical protein